MAVAIAALCSIAIVLGIYRGQPLSKWPHTIKLNTVLSALTTTMKVSMMLAVSACLGQLKWLWYRRSRSLQDFQLFDGASRGPWGSSELLFRLKFWHMASVGSVVTLLALFADAFVQQSVSYPLVPRNQATATIPYTQAYTQYDRGAGLAPNISPPILAALYNGVFSSNLTRSESSVTSTCPSGNCTFPAYASLAMCSHCHNVSSLVKSIGVPGTSDITWILPNGFSFTEQNIDMEATILNMTASGTSSLLLNTDDLAGYASPLTTNMTIISIDGPNAWDCVLSFCAKSYNPREAFGYFNETTTDTFDEPQWTLDNGVYTFDVPTTHLTTIGTWNRTFAVDEIALGGFLSALGNTLVGNCLNDVNGTYHFSTGIAQGFTQRGLKGDGIPRTLANIADALTNALQTISGQQVEGTTIDLVTHIEVDWLWMIMPLCMMVLAVFFMIVTMWKSHSSGVPSWRNSVLAVMEHGIGADTLEEISGAGSSRQAESAAVGKETVGTLDTWAEGVTASLRRRGPSGKGFGLTVI